MKTAIIMVPALFDNNTCKDWPEGLNPQEQKATLDKLLAEGFRVTHMNNFVYCNIAFTHYVLEKE